MSSRTANTPRRVRLRPQNPFDLIRLLARSQSDPRKAVAELVQNSLDAGARHIEIEWFTSEGGRAISIWDDGAGVFPELEREEALQTLARTIGHSHKRDLTPAERREQMVLGQYGIGLIGFWCVGEVLEMKSRVAGGKAWVLRLVEDRATGEVAPFRSRLLGESETFTEITIRNVHAASAGKIRPPRLQAFLANELRGQLLERGAIVRIRDRVSRGRARKLYTVEPRPYLGLPLEDLRELEVPGFENARVELYLVPAEEKRQGVVALSCGGTLVLDDIAEIDGVDAPRAPWSDGTLEGVIDFPDLHVAPGTRRGFAHDEPVAAFLSALSGLERGLLERLASEERRRELERHESLARELRRAFRPVFRRLSDYDFFRVGTQESDRGSSVQPPDESGGSEDSASGGEPLPAGREEPENEPPTERTPQGALFPPGPLARLELKPSSLRVPPLATRSVQALTLDRDGQPCAGDVDVLWELFGPGELESRGKRALYSAPDVDLDRAEPAQIRAIAVQGSVQLEAVLSVRITAPPDTTSRAEGIPEPRPISAPHEPWRSRLRGGVWEYNDAHRDYLAAAEDPQTRFRYLTHLLAKELILRNFGGPGDAETLERMVESLTYLEPRGRR